MELQRSDPIGLRIRQAAQKKAIQHAEDCRVYTDAKGQRYYH